MSEYKKKLFDVLIHDIDNERQIRERRYFLFQL
jgi:hypothetical protein